MFHAAIDWFIRSAKEQVLCRFIFRSDKLKIGPDSEPLNQIVSALVNVYKMYIIVMWFDGVIGIGGDFIKYLSIKLLNG